jgi:hypothetical protein
VFASTRVFSVRAASFIFSAKVDTKTPFRIQFVQMVQKGDTSNETFPEIALPPGRHEVSFEGKIVGWLER